MLEQAITELQNIELSLAKKNAFGSKNSFGFTLLPQGVARAVRRVPPAAREQLGHRSPHRLILVTEYESACPSGSAKKVLGIDGKLCSAKDFALHRFPYCWHWGVSMPHHLSPLRADRVLFGSRSGPPFWLSVPHGPNFGLSITDQTISMTSHR